MKGCQNHVMIDMLVIPAIDDIVITYFIANYININKSYF
jgi:hypothetical protein